VIEGGGIEVPFGMVLQRTIQNGYAV